MKFLVGAVVLCVHLTLLIQVRGQGDNSGYRTEVAKYINSINECAKELFLLGEEARESFSRPMEPPGNCVTACVWKKNGLMNENGKIIFDRMKEWFMSTHILKNEIPTSHYLTCVDKANTAEGDCKVTENFFKCVLTEFFDHYNHH